MTNKEAIEALNNWDMACPICEKRKSDEKGICADCRFIKALDLAIKALGNQPFNVDEYRKRLVDKYSDGYHATDVDNGITIALDLLDEMEEENT